TTSALVDAAGDLHVTYHRAIDVAVDASDALVALAEIGVRRILTSGASRRAIDGTDVLREFVRRAGGRVEVMAGGGVSAEQLPALAEVGVDAVHLSARGTATGFPSGPGGGHPEYDVTDVALVRAAMAARRAIATRRSQATPPSGELNPSRQDA
ncbi:MAG: copper homeostasis protein CutC, partial [Humibacter sp.]